MIKRLKRLWALSDLDENHLKYVLDIAVERSGPGGVDYGKTFNGDGNAVFLPDMTETEHEDYVHQEERGWRKFYEKFFGKA